MNTQKIIFFFFFTLGCCRFVSANILFDNPLVDTSYRVSPETAGLVSVNFEPEFSDTLVSRQNNKKEINKKKFISALFAFPFPFGFMGAHRVMLGTKPWVPVVYVLTFGGCFGVLPLIDFFVITFTNDLAPYENNPNIFMWLK